MSVPQRRGECHLFPPFTIPRSIAVLKYKWPGVFKQHPTRGENEVKMDWTQRSLEYGGKKAAKRGPKPDGYKAEPPKSAANRGQRSMMSFFGKKG